jgi:hypothetical protein
LEKKVHSLNFAHGLQLFMCMTVGFVPELGAFEDLSALLDHIPGIH